MSDHHSHLLLLLPSLAGKLEQARRLKAPSLESRAYFNLQNRPAFLQIDPIKLSDAGDYRCRVDFKKARTVNTVISLKVIGKLFVNPFRFVQHFMGNKFTHLNVSPILEVKCLHLFIIIPLIECNMRDN